MSIDPYYLFAAALRVYSPRGLFIFPACGIVATDDGCFLCACQDGADCHQPGKHPRVKWRTESSIAPADLNYWALALNTASNIALDTERSGLVVLDIDPRNGGEETWRDVVQQYGRTLTETWTVLTGGGGTHYYYRAPERVRITSGTARLGPGVDVKAAGGYVLLPPSQHKSGQHYIWETGAAPWECELADLPAALLARLTNRAATPRARDDQAARYRDIPWAAWSNGEWVETALSRVDQGAGRNDTGFWLAAQLRDAGLDQDTAAPVMQEYQARVPAGSPPYTWEEALSSLASAYQREERRASYLRLLGDVELSEGTSPSAAPSNSAPPPRDEVSSPDVGRLDEDTTRSALQGDEDRAALAVAPQRRKPYSAPTPLPVQHGHTLAVVQEETAGRIHAFLADHQAHRGQLQVIAAPPGVGKTTAALAAVQELGLDARYLVATHNQAREIEQATNGHITAVYGRSQENCQNHRVVAAARGHGYGGSVGSLVCKTCPFQQACASSGYLSQFTKSGPKVAATEFLYSDKFLTGDGPVILDDPDLMRAMLRTERLSSDELQAVVTKLADTAITEPDQAHLHDLMTACVAAVEELSSSRGQHDVAIGPQVWIALARAAGGENELTRYIAGSPLSDELRPVAADPEAGMTAADITVALPGKVVLLLDLLREELPAFLSGAGFNSGLSIDHEGLTLCIVARPVTEKVPLPQDVERVLSARLDPRPVLANRPVLYLDGTPQQAALERFAADHELARLPNYTPAVAMPAGVQVVQYVDAFYGKSTTTKSRTGVLATFQQAMQDFPGRRPAVVCPKHLKSDVVSLGIPSDQVLTYHGSRGLNAIEDADVLYVLGTPQAPTSQVLVQANVLHKGGAPINPTITLTPRAYEGYVGLDGKGRGNDFVDFVDQRAAVLLHQTREVELVQSIHRARPLRVPEGGHKRIVLITAQPVPGLPVDELVYREGLGPRTNEQRSQEAEQRVLRVIREAEAAGEELPRREIARRAGSGLGTVGRVVETYYAAKTSSPQGSRGEAA